MIHTPYAAIINKKLENFAGTLSNFALTSSAMINTRKIRIE